MADPVPYVRGYDFTAVPGGTQVNVQLDGVAASIASLVTAMADVRRSDGALQNASVTPDSLAPEAIGAFGADGEAIEAALGVAETARAAAVVARTGAETAQTGAQTARTGAETARDAAVVARTAAEAAATVATAPKTAFLAHRNAVDQTGVVPDTPTKVDFTTEVFDQGGFFASGAWVPPSGRYLVAAQVLFAAGIVAGEQYRCAVYRNGVLLNQTVVIAQGTASFSIGVVALAVVDGDDTVEVWVTGAGAGDKTISGASANTWFAGWAV